MSERRGRRRFHYEKFDPRLWKSEERKPNVKRWRERRRGEINLAEEWRRKKKEGAVRTASQHAASTETNSRTAIWRRTRRRKREGKEENDRRKSRGGWGERREAGRGRRGGYSGLSNKLKQTVRVLTSSETCWSFCNYSLLGTNS